MARRGDSGSRFPWKILLLILGGLALVVTTLLLVRGLPGLQTLLIQADTSGFTVELGADGRLNVAGFLDGVSESQINRDGTLEWLKQNWGSYVLTDGDLVGAIVELCPDIPVENLTAYQTHLKSCEEQPLISTLRERSTLRQAPFQRKAKQVRIGTPETGQPKDGQAYTCFDKEWENKRLRLFLEGTKRQIEVVARGGYDCLPGQKNPDLQINSRDAVELFGRPTRKEELAIAVVL